MAERRGSDVSSAVAHPCEGNPVVDLCLHVANVFYLLSFLGRDMLWLRILTCCGLALGIIFFSCQPTPLYGPTVWHVAFLLINLVQIWRLIGERRRLRLTEEQERVGEAAFRDLSREELVTLLTRAVWRPRRLHELEPVCGDRLTREERVLQAIAFNRLSRKELLNLLTRRLWNALKVRRFMPWQWRLRRRAVAAGERRGVSPT
jgi:hypothetical protein